jgi:uncharacterized phage protein (TIGR01671 family)
MRPVKFKAYLKKHGCIVDVEIIDWNEEYIVHEDLNNNFHDVTAVDVPDPECVTEFEDMELMQFTGLKDKNGKEIYAGDILINVTVQNPDYVAKPHLVDWANAHEYCGFVARTFNQDIGELFLNKNFLNCEIIGNIHESPDLLDIGGK